jgi:uncharacterized protein YbjQ (UPF0145 family)
VILATTTEIPGSAVGAVLGLVVGCVPFFGTTYGEGIKDLKGNTHPDVPAVLERRRQECIARLAHNARAMGADAVIGVAFDHRDITQAWRELCVYGTAVTLVPAP